MDNKHYITFTPIIIMTVLSVCAWNMRSLTYAGPYIAELSKNNDVIVGAEHRLFKYELHKLNDMFPGYSVYGKASHDLQDECGISKPGHCGISIAWRQYLDQNIKKVHVDSDRICCIQLMGIGQNQSCISIIGVYLPQQQCAISDFSKELALLESMITDCKSHGEVLVIGDFNCHIGWEYSERFWGETTKHGLWLMDMVNRQGMNVVDSDSNVCHGPNYTFNVDGVGCSYIDHCLSTPSLLSHIKDCRIIADTLQNTSDHLAIGVNIEVSNLPKKTKCKFNSRVAWSKMSDKFVRDNYTAVLDRELSRFEDMKIADTESADAFLQWIITNINTAASNLKKSKFSKGLKPYWSQVLDNLSKEERRAWHSWDDMKRPRSGPIYNQYKTAKAAFRREMRKSKTKYEKEQMEYVNRTHDMNQKHFWDLVNKAKRTQKSVSPIVCDKEVITEPDKIRMKWKEYFQDLFTPKDEPHFDNDFKAHVEDTIEKMVMAAKNSEPTVMKIPITPSEVEQCIKSLKFRKAPGWDHITSEHIKYGGQVLINALSHLYNGMVRLVHIPKHQKVGVIVAIPKGDKDSTIQGNNRGITLLPVIGKIFEKILFGRHYKWAKYNDPLDPLQGAGQERCSSVHTSLLLRETIAHNVERGSTVYVTMLDAQKAFDTVWVHGLLYQLHQSGIDPVLWLLLKELYTNFVCYIKIDGTLSDGFIAGQGVHQGAPWSMYLFQRMYNGLLTHKEKNARIFRIQTGNPAYADDLSIACLHKQTLQVQLDRVFQYSRQWRFTFNPKKSVLMIFGDDKSPTVPVMLGHAEIGIKTSDEHMGIYIGHSTEGERKFLDKRIQKAKSAFFMSQSLGTKRVPVTPVVMTKLYWSVCIPRLTHGLEIVPISTGSVDMLEQAHSNMAKWTQRLPAQTANVACLAPLGWKCIESHLDYMKLLFLWRVLCLSIDSIYKKVAIMRLWYHVYHSGEGRHIGPFFDIARVFTKYQLNDLLDCTLKSGEVLPMSQFKQIITQKVLEYELCRFKCSCMIYKSLNLFQESVDAIHMWSWWNHAHYYPEDAFKVFVLCRLLYNQNCLNCVVSHYNNSSPLCSLCAMNVVECPSHMLFECCNDLYSTRENMWHNVLQSAPTGMREELRIMSSMDKTVFIMSGFKCDYVCEWSDLYFSVLDFCYAMYKKRQGYDGE